MARAGVPIVDAGQIVEGQAWATGPADGRHFPPLVPLELYSMLGVITSSPPLPSNVDEDVSVGMVDVGVNAVRLSDYGVRVTEREDGDREDGALSSTGNHR